MTQSTQVTELLVSDNPQYMGHEKVFKIVSDDQNITAFVGVHNIALGPALGGIRYKEYDSEEDAITDVLRLSEAMTWKNAAGGLHHGGGKTVIMALPGQRKPDNAVLDVLAEGLNIINASAPVYFGAEDMNISEQALNYMAEKTDWLKGASSADPSIVGGDPSPITAMGVYECMKVAVKRELGKDDFKGLRISMQGLGAVGADLAKYAHENGAHIIACDMVDTPFENLRAQGVEVEQVALDDIYDVKADIFAPNAIGGTLSDDTIHRLKESGVKIVCGAANNQQQDQMGNSQSKLMKRLGILYCPDYIVNAGGVIWVAKVGEDANATITDIKAGVPRRFSEVLDLAQSSPDKDLGSIASEYSRQRVHAAEETRDKPAKTG